ncbi:glycosyltransferase 61 family protein [Falsiroseomonas sp. HW251]|uniref:glycosyltransferase 61 family protein n=1 Tax=Falsiroseomonas sp. HW251 TaxID=3390998 RepID=UPI003D317CA6
MPSLRWIENALVQPCSGTGPRGQGWVQDGGIYDAEGRYVPEAAHAGERILALAPALLRRDDLAPRPGRFLFGGWVHAHFGHHLVNCMGRLWPLPDLADGLDGVVFQLLRATPGRGNPLRSRPFLAGILQSLGIGPRLKPVFVQAPARFAALAVPDHLQLGMPGAPPGDDAAFLRLMRGMRRSPAVGDGLSCPGLYVSRRRLEPFRGGILFEEVLEENLAAEGYAVMYPERLTVPQQLMLYAGARRLVFAEGSALHLAIGCLEEDDRVAVIARRRPLTTPARRYLDASGVRHVAVVQAIRGAVTFTERGRLVTGSTYRGLAVPDLAAVRDQLVAAGMCRGLDWRIPAEAEVNARISATISDRQAQWPGREIGFVAYRDEAAG